MTILFIAPLPPPVTGHSLAARVLLDDLSVGHDVRVVNLTGASLEQGRFAAGRVREVAFILREVWRRRRGNDAIYLTIAETFAGNLKDLCIYGICAPSLSKLFVHLHGGSIRRLLWDRRPWVRALNRRFLKRAGGAVVLGRSHLEVFDGVMPPARVHVVPNFAEDDLFVSPHEVEEKFRDVRPLRAVFVSNFQVEKGFGELAGAWLALPPDAQAGLTIDFAGRFETPGEEAAFRQRIAGVSGLRYHGVVSGEAKRRLFAGAHLFCLPTSLLEGQPISILEAYASGCVVLATVPPGIGDIFTPGVNGFEIRERSIEAVRDALAAAMGAAGALVRTALGNRAAAAHAYRRSAYTAAMRSILTESAHV